MNPTERIEEFEGDIQGELVGFFEGGYEPLQGKALVGLEHMSPLYVDFDGSLSDAWEETLELEEQGIPVDARESVVIDGRSYTPIAWLFAEPDDSEPEGAYVVADVSDPGAPVYVADPSGEPEEIAASFGDFRARLGR